MATIKIVLDKKSQKLDKTYPVKISISHLSKTTLIATGVSVLEENWFDASKDIDPKNKMKESQVINHPNEKLFNNKIKSKFLEAHGKLMYADASKIAKMSIYEVRRFLLDGETKIEEKEINEKSIIQHFEHYISNCKAKRTAEIYHETLDKIKAYDPDVEFEQINLSWLKSFDVHLSKSCSVNTRAIHMRNIRAVFNDAINEDIISLNTYPFRKFKIRTERTIKRTLTIDQIRQLRDYPVQDHQQRYRDLFMLIFYLIGINIVDLLHLKHDNIRNGRIEYIRAKTGRPYSIKVLPEAMAVIEKYKGKDYLLNILDEYKNYIDFAARMNENLKEIGQLEWVKNKAKDPKHVKKNVKKITPLFPELIIYTARRSWATIAWELEISKDVISEALGHQTGSRVTDLYINFDLKKVDEANRKVIDAIA